MNNNLTMSQTVTRQKCAEIAREGLAGLKQSTSDVWHNASHTSDCDYTLMFAKALTYMMHEGIRLANSGHVTAAEVAEEMDNTLDRLWGIVHRTLSRAGVEVAFFGQSTDSRPILAISRLTRVQEKINLSHALVDAFAMADGGCLGPNTRLVHTIGGIVEDMTGYLEYFQLERFCRSDQVITADVSGQEMMIYTGHATYGDLVDIMNAIGLYPDVWVRIVLNVDEGSGFALTAHYSDDYD